MSTIQNLKQFENFSSCPAGWRKIQQFFGCCSSRLPLSSVWGIVICLTDSVPSRIGRKLSIRWKWIISTTLRIEKNQTINTGTRANCKNVDILEFEYKYRKKWFALNDNDSKIINILICKIFFWIKFLYEFYKEFSFDFPWNFHKN